MSGRGLAFRPTFPPGQAGNRRPAGGLHGRSQASQRARRDPFAMSGLVAGHGVAVPIGAVAVLLLTLSDHTSWRVLRQGWERRPSMAVMLWQR